MGWTTHSFLYFPPPGPATFCPAYLSYLALYAAIFTTDGDPWIGVEHVVDSYTSIQFLRQFSFQNIKNVSACLATQSFQNDHD